MEEILNRLQELKTTKVAIYHSANKDRDKNYAHGAMLAYGAAIQIVEIAMAKSPNESSGLNIPIVVQQRELLTAFMEYLESIPEFPENEVLIENFIVEGGL